MKDEVSMYHVYIYVYIRYILYIWYMGYMIYIHISYGIADTGIRDIIYIYDTDIYGIQYRTILYQFWNMFYHFKFVFTYVWVCL